MEAETFEIEVFENAYDFPLIESHLENISEILMWLLGFNAMFLALLLYLVFAVAGGKE